MVLLLISFDDLRFFSEPGPRMKNLNALRQKCSNKGICFMEVPADGNCLAWTLRSLFLGTSRTSDCSSKAAVSESQRVRKMIGDAWILVKEQRLWQAVFNLFCRDRVEDPPCTPEPKKKQIPNTDGELATPPRTLQTAKGSKKVETPAKHVPGKPERVAGAYPVALAAKVHPESPTLMQPQRKKQRLMQEPPVPDIDDRFHQIMMSLDPTDGSKLEVCDANSADVEHVEENMLSLPAEARRRRKYHLREFKSKPKTIDQRTEKEFTAWLAGREVTYVRFLSIHRQAASLRKAAVCVGNGWKAMKKTLFKRTMPECPSCLRLLEQGNVTDEAVAEYLEGLDDPGHPDRDGKADEDRDNENAKENEIPNAKKRGKNRAELKQSDYEECMAYLKSKAPIIDVLENGGKVSYRCRICTTRTKLLGFGLIWKRTIVEQC